MIVIRYIGSALLLSVILSWLSLATMSTSLTVIVSVIIGVVVGRYRDVFTWLKERVSNQRYSYLVDRLLVALDRTDIDETRELLIDFIYFVQGATRYRPISYVGEPFLCPIQREELKTGDQILILPCGHKGKYTDMKRWVDNNPSCPVCRATC